MIPSHLSAKSRLQWYAVAASHPIQSVHVTWLYRILAHFTQLGLQGAEVDACLQGALESDDDEDDGMMSPVRETYFKLAVFAFA